MNYKLKSSSKLSVKVITTFRMKIYKNFCLSHFYFITMSKNYFTKCDKLNPQWRIKLNETIENMK